MEIEHYRSKEWRLSHDTRLFKTLVMNVICTQIGIYPSSIILTELFQHNLINISYLTACYLYQIMMTLHFLNDVANDAESKQK